ncbi:MAG TPA: multicopper oxidase domain-containing protein [Terriglobales bacterium]|nr:multicopper oxidase domain-containing protein [Terriglobales bacterium]
MLFWLAAAAMVAASTKPLPPIATNQNHHPAGELRNGVSTLRLEIGKGIWHPESEDGPGLPVYAFGEAGHQLQNPGPLMRVPQGTEIHIAVHNNLPVPVSVYGLAGPGAGHQQALHLAPNTTEHATFKVGTPGVYFYWGATTATGLRARHGIDSQLNGALVVDPPGRSPRDEIFVISVWGNGPALVADQNVATINGKSWPYTQRLRYAVGEPIRWRWINASELGHAMHLHGFYYRIDASNRNGRMENYNGDLRPRVVTQWIGPGEAFDMSWSPERSGRWLFHCHMVAHMVPPTLPPDALFNSARVQAAEHAEPAAMGMGQLILGVTVPAGPGDPAPPPWHAERHLRLVIAEQGSSDRLYALQLSDSGQAPAGAAKPGLIGPPIVLTRGQPVDIEVVNHLQQPTAIHWHGIELESYYDGVPGWSGVSTEITPPIAPGASFIARMAPPRAGTFIYHTHWHDVSQLTHGLYGPLIVLPPGEKFDSASDLTFVFSEGDFEWGPMFLVNGLPQLPALHLQTGKRYRLRLINIAPNNVALQVSLHDDHSPAQWRIIAKDGADLAPRAIHPAPAETPITVGETYDAEFETDVPKELLLDFYLPGPKVHTTETLVFAAKKTLQ